MKAPEPTEALLIDDVVGDLRDVVSELAAGPAGADPGPPYLLVDLFPDDEGPAPPFDVLARTSGFFGVIIKATQGTREWYNDRGWFKNNWPRVREAGGARAGTTW